MTKTPNRYRVFDMQDSSRNREIEGDYALAVGYSPSYRDIGSPRHAAYFAALEAAGFEPSAAADRYYVERVEPCLTMTDRAQVERFFDAVHDICFDANVALSVESRLADRLAQTIADALAALKKQGGSAAFEAAVRLEATLLRERYEVVDGRAVRERDEAIDVYEEISNAMRMYLGMED